MVDEWLLGAFVPVLAELRRDGQRLAAGGGQRSQEKTQPLFAQPVRGRGVKIPYAEVDGELQQCDGLGLRGHFRRDMAPWLADTDQSQPELHVARHIILR